MDWINEELCHQGHAKHTFCGVDEAICQYKLFAGNAGNTQIISLYQEPEHKLSDAYLPSQEQRDKETVFVIIGLGAYMLTISSLYAHQVIIETITAAP